MNKHSLTIFNEYKKEEPTYDKLALVVKQLISLMIEEEHLYVVTVECRKKTDQSLKGKLQRKGEKYNSASDITDIVGARIICFYLDEIDKISAMIEKNFTIDWDKSIDKRKLYEKDNKRFGYMSLHYIVSIPKDLYYNKKYPQLNDIKFEIQMKTALQHVWATAEHDTGYKANMDIPGEYIRRLARLAGLLELADEEFNSINREVNEYKKKVSSLVKSGSFDDIKINSESFSSYLELNPFDKLINRIDGITRNDIVQSSYTHFVPALKKIGLKTIGDLERMKNDYSEEAYQLVLLIVNQKGIEEFDETIALFALSLIYIYHHDGDITDIKEFIDCFDSRRSKFAANALFELLNQVKTIA